MRFSARLICPPTLAFPPLLWPQGELQASRQAAEAAGRRADEAEARVKAAEEAAAAATAASPQAGRASQPTSPPNSHAAVSAAVAAALGGGGDQPALEDLLSPGGTTLRFGGPTVGYAEAVAASPPQAAAAQGRASRPTSVSPPSGGVRGLSGRLPHSRGDSISSEIEPADEPAGPQGAAGAAAARPPRVGSRTGSPFAAAAAGGSLRDAAAAADQLTAAQARLAALEQELADSERTHALRDRATAVLKEEIAELR